ncbi:MAG: undecaprenyl-diphosphatase [Thermoleophilaceae bacterium]|jgi:undecaprenyl-diphosphatase|nr:undecaprenyl-diphosphatase [Thermoleophilaceae bacterium]
MSIFEAIVLGIVQGLTEFLPISSTAHLRIVPAVVGWDDPGSAFTAVIQLGTTLAVLIYFRDDLWRIGRAWLGSLRGGVRGVRASSSDARLGWYIVIGTIPIGIFGLAFKHDIEHGARDLYLIGTVLIVFGLVMLAAERYGQRTRELESMRPADGVFVGAAQALALVPGVSRSGATISAGLFRGLTREAAARYSFLLSTPAIVLAALFELKGIVDGSEHTGASTADLLVATFFAFVVGYWSISFLLRFITRHGLVWFVLYRLALGALVLALTAGGAIS